MNQSRAPRIAAVILAAGQSRRMGEDNKLLAEIDDKPMVCHVIEAVLDSRVGQTFVVTGHNALAIENAVAEFDVELVRNPLFDNGLSTSLRAGMRRILDVGGFDAAIIVLGDMPGLTQCHLDRLIASFDPARDREICLPTIDGKRRNPVLFARRFFEEMTEMTGDAGARSLIESNDQCVFEVTFEDGTLLDDIDTPDGLAAYRKIHSPLKRHSP